MPLKKERQTNQIVARLYKMVGLWQYQSEFPHVSALFSHCVRFVSVLFVFAVFCFLFFVFFKSVVDFDPNSRSHESGL